VQLSALDKAVLLGKFGEALSPATQNSSPPLKISGLESVPRIEAAEKARKAALGYLH
jgi:hypothetical protein